MTKIEVSHEIQARCTAAPAAAAAAVAKPVSLLSHDHKIFKSSANLLQFLFQLKLLISYDETMTAVYGMELKQ